MDLSVPSSTNTPHSSTSSHRRDLKHSSVNSTLSSARTKRRTHQVEVRSQRRDLLISAKRFRHPTDNLASSASPEGNASLE
jgi:hypothetical protein